MGVQDLNKLISIASTVEFGSSNYQNIIIDALNLLMILIYRSLSNLPSFDEIEFKNFKVKSKNKIFIPLNIQEQLMKLKTNLIRDIKALISNLDSFTDIENIYLISDPIASIKYKYVYNENIKMNCGNKDLYDHWIKINKFKIDDPENIEILFSSKDDERKSRVQANKEPTIELIRNIDNKLIMEINDYNIFNPKSDNYKHPEDLTPEEISEIEYIYKILYVTTYFNKRSNLFGMMLYFQSEINKLTVEIEKLKYITSYSEADIFIKAFYKNNLLGTRTLVLSNDTDYFMLFADLKDVDVSKISPLDLTKIYNPYTFWSSHLKTTNPNYIKNIIPRISALFGNDYTIHSRLIVSDSKFLEYVCSLFQIDKFREIKKNITENKIKKNTSIYKFINTFEQIVSIVERFNKRPVSSLVDLLNCVDLCIIKHEVDNGKIRYFNGYYETLLIYLNYDQYSKIFSSKKSLLECGNESYERMNKNIIYDIDFSGGYPVVKDI